MPSAAAYPDVERIQRARFELVDDASERLVLPALSLQALAGEEPVSTTNVAWHFVGHRDPLLILSVVGLALVAPVPDGAFALLERVAR